MEETIAMLVDEIEQAVHESEIQECVWQSLIFAYLGLEGWREAAVACFEKAGYTETEIVSENGGFADGTQ